jgi:ACS family hexuronate transporter-like MFS transporter
MKVLDRRWWVCGMLFTASVIAFIDRQTLSIVAPILATEFRLNNEDVGRILSAFLLSYTVGQLLAGRFFDWIGSRIAFTVSMGVWSLANILTAGAGGFWGLASCRFLLGIGESGNFPGGVKVISEWFPKSERALAGGLFTSGASVGAVLAGPLVGTIAHHWGWRAAFAATGSLGFLWLAAWWFLFGAEERARASTPVVGAAFDSSLSVVEQPPRWSDLLRNGRLWVLTLARFLEEPAYWVWLFWLPKYVVDVSELTVLQAGWLLTLPYLALDVGYVSGGWLSSRLLKRGWSSEDAKLAVMAASALLMMSSILAVLCSRVVPFMALISLALAGHGAWFTNALTMPADVAPRGLVASFYGITALGGGLGGIISTQATGIVADRFHSFAPVFVAAGLLPILATGVLLLPRGRE